MTKMDWEKRNRLEKPRDPDRESRLERQANRILADLGATAGKKEGRQPPRVLRARESKPPAPNRKSRKCDIWVTWGADSPWNPTPGVRCVMNVTSMAEAKRLGLR